VGKKDPASNALKNGAEYNGEQQTYALNPEKFALTWPRLPR
jgi:hypothetical protein